jgi:hypothetical protein
VTGNATSLAVGGGPAGYVLTCNRGTFALAGRGVGLRDRPDPWEPPVWVLQHVDAPNKTCSRVWIDED